MTIKNMLTAAMFKTDDAGRTVVYPNGAMGRGYIVPDPATEQRMRRVLQWAIIGSGLIGGVGTQVMLMVYGQVFEWTGEPWGIALVAMMVLGFAYRSVAGMLTRGMVPVQARLGMVEAMRKQAEAMPRWYLWSVAIFAPMMVVGSAAWLVAGASLTGYVVGFVGVILFGMVTAQAIYGLKSRLRT